MRFAHIEQPNKIIRKSGFAKEWELEKGVKTITVDLDKITHFEVLELHEYLEPVVCMYLGNVQVKTRFTTVEAAMDFVLRTHETPVSPH